MLAVAASFALAACTGSETKPAEEATATETTEATQCAQQAECPKADCAESFSVSEWKVFFISPSF